MKIESVGLSFSTNHHKWPPYTITRFPEEWLAGRTRIGVSETRAKMPQETKEPLSLALLCRVETSIFKPLWKISLNILKVSHFESIILWGYPQSCSALAEQLSTLAFPQPSQATETFAPVGLHRLGLLCQRNEDFVHVQPASITSVSCIPPGRVFIRNSLFSVAELCSSLAPCSFNYCRFIYLFLYLYLIAG